MKLRHPCWFALFFAVFMFSASLTSCAGGPSLAGKPAGEATKASLPADTPPAASFPPSLAPTPSTGVGTRSAEASPEPSIGFVDSTGSGTDAMRTPAPGTSAARVPTQSGLKAGFSDDNAQYKLFMKFLGQYATLPHEDLAVGERILVKIEDVSGRPVAGALVEVLAGDGAANASPISRGQSYADGAYALYPLEYAGAPLAQSYRVEISSPAGRATAVLRRSGERTVPVRLASARSVASPLPVDILFVFDTTGSMGEEIEGLRATIESSNRNIAAQKPAPSIRFGMVLYRDEGDEYVTRPVPFTDNLELFQKVLDGLEAGGGGDTPEDLVDYSSFGLAVTTRLAVMPILSASGAQPADPTPARQAEYFGEQLSLAAARSRLFAIVERKDLQSVPSELERQLSGIVDEGQAAPVGKVLGEEVHVTGTIYRTEARYELFLKLVRVESAEILSIAKAKIDIKLGLQ